MRHGSLFLWRVLSYRQPIVDLRTFLNPNFALGSFFTFMMGIGMDRENNVIAGHGRLLACRELGWSEVPTLCLDHLTPAQVRAFRIADNRLTEISAWDDRLLAEELKELSLLGLDFDIEVTGVNQHRTGTPRRFRISAWY
jgi:hypothetical protein